MTKLTNPIDIGFGWSQDLHFRGHEAGDTLYVSFRRRVKNLLPRISLEPVQIDVDDIARVRLDGDETNLFLEGVYAVEIVLVRGTGSGVLTGFPDVEARRSILQAGPSTNDPLLGGTGAPVRLTIDNASIPAVSVSLVFGGNGLPGEDGVQIDDTTPGTETTFSSQKVLDLLDELRTELTNNG